ncbi:MAG: hypothetical protein JO229_09680 [Alphaproteobacteria bacterium]|nr:hypothetical protein [Alphaproteobacteria bacterium]
MYVIHFVEDRDVNRSVCTEKFTGSALADALAQARLSFKKIHLLVPQSPWSSDVIGFIIYDDAGREVAREYPGESSDSDS